MPATDNEWEPIVDDEPAERLLMDDFRLIDEITNPVRSRLIQRLRRPSSAAALAEHAASLATAMGALFDVAKAELQSEIEQGALEGVGMEDERWLLGLTEVHSVSPDRAKAIVARLKEVVEEELTSDAEPEDADAHRLTFFIAAFPRSD